MRAALTAQIRQQWRWTRLVDFAATIEKSDAPAE